MALHPKEAELINRIRNKHRWGEILIEVRDGLPVRIGKTVTYESLDGPKLSTELDVTNDS